MCTMIVETAKISGSGKGSRGWFEVNQVNVSFDHPFHAQMEHHAINIDFVNPDMGLDARVAVEMSPESARQLMEAIGAALARGEAEVGLVGSVAD